MKNYIQFIHDKKQSINESFKENDLDKVIRLLTSSLNKRCTKRIIPLVSVSETQIESENCISKFFMVADDDKKTMSVFAINWLKNKSSVEAYSILFFKNVDVLFNLKTKSPLSLYTMGRSIVYFIPIIAYVINNDEYDLSQKEIEKLSRNDVKESNILSIEDFKYVMNENISHKIIRDTFMITETMDDTLMSEAADDKQLNVGIRHGEQLKNVNDKKTDEVENELKEQREDPEIVFKKMDYYIKMVIKGINPSVILCGGPGVGKTFHVKKALKENGFVEGDNLYTIKGKCTERMLYLRLYEYRRKGDIVVIDDADSLVGPKAPETVINILKAALDSSNDEQGRLVTYGISTQLQDDDGNPIPKRMYYKGGCIIITNWNVGALDTALRGRSFIQDINFTVEDVLNIIEKLMPKIMPEILSEDSKQKAFKYLKKLADEGTEMEISIRTFGICGKLFESMRDEDLGDEFTESMIKEQMTNQALRGRNKY